MNDYYSTNNEERPQKGGKVHRDCNDVFFVLIFLAAVIFTLVFAIKDGNTVLTLTSVPNVPDTTGLKLLLTKLAYVALIAIGCSIVWVAILLFFGEFLIWLAIFAVIVGTALAGIFLTVYMHDHPDFYVNVPYWIPAVVCGVVLLLEILFLCCNWRRIRFAGKNLKVSARAILSHPLLFVTTLVTSFVQMAWALTWALATLSILLKKVYESNGTVTFDTNCLINNTCNFKDEIPRLAGQFAGITIGMVFLYFFVQATIGGTVIVTIAGVVGTWWIQAKHGLVTLSATLRSWTLSLGSVAFGALMVAILETIRWIAETASSAAAKSGNIVVSCLLCCFACCVGCIEQLIKYINKYAYVYCGVYGYSFITAGGHVFELFSSRGWSAIANDTLVDTVIWLSCLATGALCSYLGVVLQGQDQQVWNGIPYPPAFLGTGGFLIGYSISRTFLNMIHAAVATVFVLWAEDPASLNLTHPELYMELSDAWKEIYPEEWQKGQRKDGGSNNEYLYENSYQLHNKI